MEQPSGFVAQGESRRVCKLKKALYGLKQSPRAWFGKFSNAKIKCGLRRSVYDHFVFYSSSNAGCILLVVYVDDIVITGSDNVEIKKLKSFIGTCFQTKDLGSLKYFLGIEVSCSSKGICLSQRKYCLDLLDDVGQIEAKPCDEPMIPKLKLKSEDERLLQNPKKYRRIVRKLNNLTIC
ncbi:retrovirus-related pol polyprotein from transposon RE1 [Tanacetum coccineum]|uniref:Retrovirus-related pol polyprotein from transposon RE1 n=1 Tax=Tanacetum coccineum TaxID=301880 RepID=A0ABQ4WKE8_9ASTR